MDGRPKHPGGASQRSTAFRSPAPTTQYVPYDNESFDPYESQTHVSSHTPYSTIGSISPQYSPLLPHQESKPMRQPFYRIPSDDKTSMSNSASTVRLSFDGMSSRGPPSTLPRKHPFARTFESPNWQLLTIHTIFCLLAYPVILASIIIAEGRSLSWTRSLVGAGCGLVGFFLGFSLLQLGKGFLQASTWATVIHQSYIPDDPGIRLRDLAARSQDPTSAWSAFRLLWDRSVYVGTSRRNRRSYDTRPWSLYILFFLFLVVTAASLTFLLGRLVVISTTVAHQSQYYHEVAVMGDLSTSDIATASSLVPAFDNFLLTWTLSPFSAHGGLPPAVSFKFDLGDGEVDDIYFSETALSQLLPGGSGFGTFETATRLPVNHTNDGQKTTVNDPSKPIDPGNVLRYPRWGIRIRCLTLPDPDVNIVPRSNANYTYTFTPRATLRSLFDSFKLPFPATLEAPVNGSAVLRENDTFPAGLDVAATSTASFLDNGVALTLLSAPLSLGEDGKGWVTLESVLVRLDTTFTPDGKFARLSDSVLNATGQPTRFGYDSAVCLELYEPWILETFNQTTGLPTSIRIVSKGNSITDQNTEHHIEQNTGPPLTDLNIGRRLDSTNLTQAYIAAHVNSVNQLVKDNGRDGQYVPNPTVVSFTTGQGPYGYTEFSPEIFAQVRAQADASNVLPYFAGTGPVVARSYPDQVKSSAAIELTQMAIALGVILIVGWIAGLFVPKLPMGVPRRDFELYSWLAAFHADEFVGERSIGLAKNMELADIQESIGGLKFRYLV